MCINRKSFFVIAGGLILVIAILSSVFILGKTEEGYYKISEIAKTEQSVAACKGSEWSDCLYVEAYTEQLYAILLYPQETSDEETEHLFSIYIASDNTDRYVFRWGGSSGSIQRSYGEWYSFAYGQSIFLSENNVGITKMLLEDGETLETEEIELSASEPFVFVIDTSRYTVSFYDSDGNQIKGDFYHLSTGV